MPLIDLLEHWFSTLFLFGLANEETRKSNKCDCSKYFQNVFITIIHFIFLFHSTMVDEMSRILSTFSIKNATLTEDWEEV